MVTINGYQLRQNNDGKQFIVLELLGEVELIQSSQTGCYYATAKRCSIPSTFSEEMAKSLIGTALPGKIDRVEAEPYEYLIKETDEVVTLSHRYVYSPMEQAKVLSNQPSTAI